MRKTKILEWVGAVWIAALIYATIALAIIFWKLPARGDVPTGFYVGVDAQPVENYPLVKDIGNAVHRYDPGPQKNVKLADAIAAAKDNGLSILPQGTAAEDQGVDLSKFDNVIGVAHNDEPDLNRYKAGITDPSIFRPKEVDNPAMFPAPHPSMNGWTIAPVLLGRNAAWHSKWPKLQTSVNLNGKNLTNPYYRPDLWMHAGYIAASNQQTFDVYPANNGYPLYFLPLCYDKLDSAGNPVGAYVEISDQALDGSESGGNGRGPTPVEQGTQFWSLIGHGARQIWYFPQRIGKDGRMADGSMAFKYWNVKPENLARAKDDWATLQKYGKLIGGGTRQITDQQPPFAANYDKGTNTLPNRETFVWTLGAERLAVAVDYTGQSPPTFNYAGPTPEPTPAPPAPDPAEIAALKATIAQLQASQAATAAELAGVKAALNDAAGRLANVKAAIEAPPATQPTTQPTSARPVIYLWTGSNITRPQYADPAIGAVVGVDVSWGWGGNPWEPRQETLGLTLALAAGSGYVAPIAIDEGWGWEQYADAIDNAVKLADANSWEGKRIRWMVYNVPANENYDKIAAGPGNPWYDKWAASVALFKDSPVAKRVCAACPQMYPYDVDETPARWLAFADGSLPVLEKGAADAGLPLWPVISPHTSDWNPGRGKTFGRDMMEVMLTRLVDREGLSVVVWANLAANPDEALAYVREFARMRAIAVVTIAHGCRRRAA